MNSATSRTFHVTDCRWHGCSRRSASCGGQLRGAWGRCARRLTRVSPSQPIDLRSPTRARPSPAARCSLRMAGMNLPRKDNAAGTCLRLLPALEQPARRNSASPLPIITGIHKTETLLQPVPVTWQLESNSSSARCTASMLRRWPPSASPPGRSLFPATATTPRCKCRGRTSCRPTGRPKACTERGEVSLARQFLRAGSKAATRSAAAQSKSGDVKCSLPRFVAPKSTYQKPGQSDAAFYPGVCYFCSKISTRRLSAFPAVVAFVSAGLLAAKPPPVRRDLSIPCASRK